MFIRRIVLLLSLCCLVLAGNAHRPKHEQKPTVQDDEFGTDKSTSRSGHHHERSNQSQHRRGRLWNWLDERVSGRAGINKDCGRFVGSKRRVSNKRRPNGTSAARIAGGYTARSGQIPSYAYLVRRLDGLVHCGATIVTANHLLTAAHCVRSPNNEFDVGIGSTPSSQNLIRPAKICLHPQAGDTPEYDVAVVRLPASLDFSSANVQPACLPDSALTESELNNLITSGLGETQSGDPQQLQLLNVVEQDCPSKSVAVLCFVDPLANARTCSGDSGSGTYMIRGGKLHVVAVTHGAQHSDCRVRPGSDHSLGANIYNLRKGGAHFAGLDELIMNC